MTSQELARAHAASAAATRRLLDGMRTASYGSTAVLNARHQLQHQREVKVDVPVKAGGVAVLADGLPGDMPVVVRAISNARSSGDSSASTLGDKSANSLE